MRRAKSLAELGFNRSDAPRLKKAMNNADNKRAFQRLQAVFLVAQGRTIIEVAEISGVSQQTIYNWVRRYLNQHQVKARLFPVLRRALALRGEQSKIGITSRNAKRVLFGAINPRAGHRIIQRSPNLKQEHFRAFLRLLRRSYFGRQIWLLLDEAPGHIAAKSQALAKQLDIVFLWLPKQCSELNAMDQRNQDYGQLSMRWLAPSRFCLTTQSMRDSMLGSCAMHIDMNGANSTLVYLGKRRVSLEAYRISVLSR
jgi:transposase-like protein